MATYDYVVVGSGIAGLYMALLAQQYGRVALVTKASLEDCNTRYAQGGIAAAIAETDSPELHLRDTLVAGAGLCDEEAVRILATEGPRRIRDLVEYGVPFDRVDGRLALTREAAHSVPRILHAGGDATGANIESTLSHAARAAEGVDIFEHHFATDILVNDDRALGVTALDGNAGVHRDFYAAVTILATGGAGQLFAHTTNPDVATGDGVALAVRAGAALADLEFFQFHPTALCLPGVPRFLISEAVRGEGGLLVNHAGRRFMLEYDERAELAPRDVVARAILSETEREGHEHVWLDVRHLPDGYFARRFPSIYRFCRGHDIEPSRDLIPVTPAAHYMMGGVRTNVWGETTLAGLYAAGETACTGVHGANRLASNSLLEVLVFGNRIIRRTTTDTTISEEPAVVRSSDYLVKLPSDPAVIDGRASEPISRQHLRDLMWSNAGIRRDGDSLAAARTQLAGWAQNLPVGVDRETHELRNLVLLAHLTVEAALIREESRGAHFRTDFPTELAAWRRRIVFADGAVRQNAHPTNVAQECR